MNYRFSKLPEVMKMTALSRASVYRKVDTGEFPSPIKIGPGRTGGIAWSERAVLGWMRWTAYKSPPTTSCKAVRSYKAKWLVTSD